jgi:hypothetical protein
VTTPADHNADAILRQNAQRAANRGEIRQHEVEKVTRISHELWHGSKGNGQATSEAVEIVKKGLA